MEIQRLPVSRSSFWINQNASSINQERIRIERHCLRRAIDELGANLGSNNYDLCYFHSTVHTFLPGLDLTMHESRSCN